MMGTGRRTLLRVGLSILAASTPAAAAEPQSGVDVCIAAHAGAQKDRTAGRLVKARLQLMQCARPECPDLARNDCTQWLAEVDKDLPSIVVVATDAQGQDLSDVLVSVDGELLAQQASGEAIPLDPGPHSLRFERAGSAPVEQKIVLRVGERNRRIRVSFAPKAASPPPKPPPKPDPEQDESAPVPAASWILGGIGVVALASFGYFGATGESKQADLDECKPGCDSDDVSDVRTHYLAADISLAVGVLALGGATYFYLTRPSRSAEHARHVGIGAVFGPSGGLASVAGSF